MREDNIIAMMPPDALRALADYYEVTAEILRRRADRFDPPPPPKPHPAKQIFEQIPDFVAALQQDGHSLERAITLVMIRTTSTRERVELALKMRRKQDRAALTDLRIQQARAMKNAGASVMDIARAIGTTERHARRLLSSGYSLIETECDAADQ
ncbi:hypothetical protein [Asticcacaulis sp.]|uniref:hypothetical protein n=1 Tax=Asticcacaulis sp. TaxID=1872648 RepID=UPI0026267ACA|nr:hypothetical protein [Asticcacaulis sp.]